MINFWQIFPAHIDIECTVLSARVHLSVSRNASKCFSEVAGTFNRH